MRDSLPLYLATCAGSDVNGGAIAVFRLTADVGPLLEAAGKIHPRHKVVRHVGKESGMVTLFNESFRDGPLFGRHGLPARKVDIIPGNGMIVIERECAPAAVKGAASGNGG